MKNELRLVWILAAVVAAGGLPCSAGESEEPAVPGRLAAARPNTWVMLDAGSYGARNSVGLVFLPEDGQFLLLGGSPTDTGRYSEQMLSWSTGRWENRFPTGKAGQWGEPNGVSRAPAFDRYSAFRDAEGTVRPNLAYGYNHRMELWGNCAYDRSRGKVVVPWHVRKQTSEYDPKSGAWQIIESAKDAPDEFWDDCVFGSMAYDSIHKEVLTGQCRWAFRNGRWDRRDFGSKLINSLRGQAETVHSVARRLLGASRARLYRTEPPQVTDAAIGTAADGLAGEIERLAGLLAAAGARGYEQTQIDWAKADLKKAGESARAAREAAKGEMTAKRVHAVEDAWNALDRVVADLSAAPPPRAYTGLACDLKRGKFVLFGGHELDRLLADTWVYDCRSHTWEQRRPKMSPSPRYGHGLAWLPDSGKVLLVDGCGYGPSGQTWVYDIDADEWNLLAEADSSRPCLTSYASTWGWQPEPAAAGAGDVAVALCNVNTEGKGPPPRYSTWAARIDPARIDAAGTARLGVPPGTAKPAGEKADDPRWYEQNAGTIDTEGQEAWISRLPANTWVRRESARNRPDQNRAWGTAVYDPQGEQILHWGGGHVAYIGNAVLHYSTRSGQYFINYPAEQGLRYAHGQGGMPIGRTYRGRPFMTGHAYHSQAYDPPSKTLIVCGQDPKVMVKAAVFFAYDPLVGDWAARPIPAPFAHNYSTTILCSTPSGAVAWNGQELWRLDLAANRWNKLALSGKLPPGGPDRHGMTYDSSRDRLLLFSRENKGEVVAHDIATGRAAGLAPRGRDAMPGLSSREAIYMPDADAVLLAARLRDAQGRMRWPIYDCRKNAWRAVLLAGEDPIAGPKGRREDSTFNAGLGLMYDARRKLVWAADSYTNISALRLDLTTADMVDLGAP